MSTQIKAEKPKTSRSLTATLAISFLALSVAVLLIASSLEIFFNFQTQQELVASKQQLIAQDAAKTVASFVQEKFGVLETAVKLGNPASVSRKEQKRVLENLLGLQPAFRQLVLLNPQEQELAKVSRLSQAASGQLADQAESDLFAQVKQGERYIGPVYIDEITSEPLVIMAVPATDVLGDFQGTLMVEVNLKFMWDLVDRLEIGETGLAYVVDRQGNLIAFGDTARVLRGENVGHLKEVGEFTSNPAPVDETGANISSGINGTTIVGTYVPLGVPDWAVVTELPVEEAYREVIRDAAISVGVMLAVAVLAGLIGVGVARRLSVPLRNLTETATRIAGGETGLQAAIAGPAEVASLARAFNSMTAQLRELINSLKQRNEYQRATVQKYVEYMAEVGEGNLSARLSLEGDEHEADDPLMVLGHNLNEMTANLQRMITTVEEQRETILGLSTPVVPVLNRVLVLPLIGSIDTARAQQIMEMLLEAIGHHGAEVVIIDITGVAMVDTRVADGLIQVITAAGLLGAKCVLVGISPEVAQTIISLGIDLSAIVTRSDLQSGIVYALGQLRQKIVSLS